VSFVSSASTHIIHLFLVLRRALHLRHCVIVPLDLFQLITISTSSALRLPLLLLLALRLLLTSESLAGLHLISQPSLIQPLDLPHHELTSFQCPGEVEWSHTNL